VISSSTTLGAVVEDAAGFSMTVLIAAPLALVCCYGPSLPGVP
jgi:hypothetical protein